MTEYDDRYPTCAETYSSLRVLSADITADEASARLGIQPTYKHAVGDPVTRDGRGSRTEHAWILDSRGWVDSRDCRRHIDWLLNRVEPSSLQLRELVSSGVRADVSCYWLSAQGHGGPKLSPDQMDRLARLQLECWFDVYFAG